jgi:hypothetical protein
MNGAFRVQKHLLQAVSMLGIVAFGALVPVVAQTPNTGAAPGAGATAQKPDCRPAISAGATFTFYAPNQTCKMSFEPVLRGPRDLTINGGADEMVAVTPTTGTTGAPGDPAMTFTVTSGPKAGAATFSVHVHFTVPKFKSKGTLSDPDIDVKYSVVNKY